MDARARVCAFYFTLLPLFSYCFSVGIVFAFFVSFRFVCSVGWFGSSVLILLLLLSFMVSPSSSLFVCLSHCECFVVCYQFNFQDCIPCTRTGGISKSCFMFQHYFRMRSMIRKSCRGNVTLATTSCALYFWRPITRHSARRV